jgi:cystathionine beta-lyase/cystathionine gamma-synthase
LRVPAGFSTRAINAAKIPPVSQQTPSVPLFQTSTFRFDTADDYAETTSFRKPGFTYSRGYGNPTVAAFESVMAELEGTEAAFGFASGMAAISTLVLSLVRTGDRIVATSELYGGAHNLFTKVLPRFGVEVRSVPAADLERIEEELHGAALFYTETISNPNVVVADLPRLGEMCRRAGVTAVIDNTFASPYLCNPYPHGFSYVIHSATKFIGGHHDLIGGVICTDAGSRDRLRDAAIDAGGTMAPFEAWLSVRGLMTLELRMRRHCESAAYLAAKLEGHPKLERVRYPGLASDPQHEFASKLLPRGFGGILALDVAGGVEGGKAFCDNLQTAWIATSLGGVHTLVGHAASTTHRQLDEEARRRAGIGDGLVRVSVGLEDAEDLLEDVLGALESI